MEYQSTLKTEAVLVPGEFIKDFMAAASGDYVKVYLWLLQNGSADIENMAARLMLSEGDVRRAIRYWQEKKVLASAKETGKTSGQTAGKTSEAPVKAAAMEAGSSPSLREKYRGTRCTEILDRLSEDTEFSELIIIVQRYLSKILVEREVQVFAYLYDGLNLPVDVLDYLVAYAVDHGHANIRYIEKLGSDWAELGIRDVAAAKRRTKQFESGMLTAGTAGKTAGTAGKASGAAGDKTSGKTDGGAGGNRTPRKDYNEMVMQELLQNMGD